MFTYFVDEKKFLTPYMRAIVDARPPRAVNQQFENIYWTKRKEVKAFYDAGGGDLITLGTDHPSWGEFFTPFSVHRELQSLSLSGIPNAAVLRIATINSARAIGLGDRLGTIEAGKWADLVVVRGNPLAGHSSNATAAARDQSGSRLRSCGADEVGRRQDRTGERGRFRRVGTDAAARAMIRARVLLVLAAAACVAPQVAPEPGAHPDAPSYAGRHCAHRDTASTRRQCRRSERPLDSDDARRGRAARLSAAPRIH